MQRRRLLLTAGITFGSLLAGCTESENEDVLGSQDESTDEQDGDDGSSEEASTGVNIVGQTATMENDEEVGRISLMVGKSEGAGDVDLGEAVIQWVGPDGEATLTHSAADPTPGAEFTSSAIVGDDPAMLTGQSDRIEITVPLDEGGSVDYLGAGEQTELKLVLQSGSEHSTTLLVPDSLSTVDSGDNIQLGSDDGSSGDDGTSSDDDGASDESTDGVSNGINIISTTGTVENGDEIGRISLMVGKSEGSGDVDLGEAVIQWTDADATTTLAYSAADPTPGAEFTTSAVTSDDRTVLTERSDRIKITVPLDEGGSVDYLGAGEQTELKLILQSGSERSTALVVPDSLGSVDSGDSIRL